MKPRIYTLVLSLLLCSASSFALEPNEILVIANSEIPESLRIARYYCTKRNVSEDNIFTLPLGKTLRDTITRADYDRKIAGPIRKKLATDKFAGKIKCLLTIYGVPFKVQGRGMLKNQAERLQRFQAILQQEKQSLEKMKQTGIADNSQYAKKLEQKITDIQLQIDRIEGKETSASLDSELSMVLFVSYELHRWQRNKLKKSGLFFDFKTLMVSRIDGPSAWIAMNLVDKAMIAEKSGLKGFAYIDSRGIKDNQKPFSYGYYDQSLRDLADIISSRTDLTVRDEQTPQLFAPGDCPYTAIYCGWYSLGKYIDAFDFVNGAIGYHIASIEAADLHNINSTQWCPAMLKDGITATLGPVAEPYLHAFPEPQAFFSELFDGRCLVEAYYRTKPFNSWQLMLIGDPLYKPFQKP